MSKSKSNAKIDALKAAGYQIKSPLPEPYEQVIEGLSEREIEVLIDVKQRFEEAGTRTESDAGAYTAYFLPF